MFQNHTAQTLFDFRPESKQKENKEHFVGTFWTAALTPEVGSGEFTRTFHRGGEKSYSFGGRSRALGPSGVRDVTRQLSACLLRMAVFRRPGLDRRPVLSPAPLYHFRRNRDHFPPTVGSCGLWLWRDFRDTFDEFSLMRSHLDVRQSDLAQSLLFLLLSSGSAVTHSSRLVVLTRSPLHVDTINKVQD